MVVVTASVNRDLGDGGELTGLSSHREYTIGGYIERYLPAGEGDLERRASGIPCRRVVGRRTTSGVLDSRVITVNTDQVNNED